MEQLRGPDGCPWDREQTLESLRTYLVEEAHEVIEAIDAGSLEALREELGISCCRSSSRRAWRRSAARSTSNRS